MQCLLRRPLPTPVQEEFPQWAKTLAASIGSGLAANFLWWAFERIQGGSIISPEDLARLRPANKEDASKLQEIVEFVSSQPRSWYRDGPSRRMSSGYVEHLGYHLAHFSLGRATLLSE